jgi:hypothetical protein
MRQELAVAPLFDVSGRRIKTDAIVAPVNSASDRYALAQPRIDHSAIHARISEHLGGAGELSVGDFKSRAVRLIEALSASDATRQLLQGVHVPFFLPQRLIADIGEALEEIFLPAVGSSWRAQFPKYDFRNELKGGLAGKVNIAPGSRYERLLRAMESGPVVGMYFPLALSGFSVDAALQQMSDLPDDFLLAGGVDASAALVGCPEMIMKIDGYAPQLDLSGIEGRASRYGYHFAPYGYNLTFNGRYHNGLASDYCASGLTWISQKF